MQLPDALFACHENRWFPDRAVDRHAPCATNAGCGLDIVPLAVQRRIVDYLARMKRLEPPAPGRAPLIRLIGARIAITHGQRVADVVIHSRIKTDGKPRSYDTRFRVFCGGRIERFA